MHKSNSGRGEGGVVIGRGNFHWAFFRNFTFKYAVFVDDGFKLMIFGPDPVWFKFLISG